MQKNVVEIPSNYTKPAIVIFHLLVTARLLTQAPRHASRSSRGLRICV